MANDAVASVPTLQDVEAGIAAAIEPLRQQLKAVEGRERMILADLEQTREAKQRLVSTLRKIDPSMPRPGGKPGPKPSRNGAPDYGKAERHKEAVAAAINAIDRLAYDEPDGFTRTRVHTQLKAAGFAIGDSRLQAVMDELHTSGYLTLHKLVTGGNKSYLRTEDLSNGSPRQAD